MIIPIKNLITSGCSFTNDEDISTWSTYLQKELKPQWNKVKYTNYARTSAGNGYISSSLIYGVYQAMKTWPSNELLVGVMWSGSNRHEVFKKDPDLYDYQNTGTTNPVGFIEKQKKWILLNYHWEDELSTNYYEVFDDMLGAQVKTYENILKVQWFLKSHNIRYFMSTFAPSALPNEDLRDDPNIKYLYDMVDWKHFLPVESCMEWCVNESGLPNGNDSHCDLWARHPTSEQHAAFTKRVIMPHLKNIGYID